MGVVCGERSANRDIFDWPVGGGNSAVDSQAFHLLMLAHSHRVRLKKYGVWCTVYGVWCGGAASDGEGVVRLAGAQREERDCSSILRVQRAAISVFFNQSFFLIKLQKYPCAKHFTTVSPSS